jgi:hypothetical protein
MAGAKWFAIWETQCAQLIELLCGEGLGEFAGLPVVVGVPAAFSGKGLDHVLWIELPPFVAISRVDYGLPIPVEVS